MPATLRALVASVLIAGALLLTPSASSASSAQDRPSDPNGCEDTPAAEHCQNPGNCENTPGAEHCQKGNDVLGASVERETFGGSGDVGLLSLPRTGAGVAVLLAAALAAIGVGLKLRSTSGA